MQDKDIIPGISLPNKRRKTASEGSDSKEDLKEEPFVDLHGRSSESAKLAEVSEEAAMFTEAAFNAKLKNAERAERMEFLTPDG